MLRSVAVVGAGPIGLGWSVVFSRAGVPVKLYDLVAERAEATTRDAQSVLGNLWPDRVAAAGTISVMASLSAAVSDVDYVQECIVEEVQAKRAIFGELARHSGSHALLCSSASALLPDDFLDGSACQRSIVAHPFNPCYLLPAVELVPSRWTSIQTMDRSSSILRSVGLSPVVVRKPIFGYIGNRLQAAVVNEAMSLIADGVATPDELDAVMTGALGPRWALSGPFETMDLNAPGGIAEYADKYANAYAALGKSLRSRRKWPREALDAAIASRRASVPTAGLPARARARDTALAQLCADLRKLAYVRE